MDIRTEYDLLKKAATRGGLGEAIAAIVLEFSTRDILQMNRNFRYATLDIDPVYRRRLTEKVSEHLSGTYQTIRLMRQQGAFLPMHEPVTRAVPDFWEMVAGACTGHVRDPDSPLRFLKFLLSGFCMVVLLKPGHPVGTPFPGGDAVEFIDGQYFCPVREKANDVDSALCPFSPALQTPEIGYLKPPVNPSPHRRQEFIDHYWHNYNG
jgi:uncharacterized protein (UPF0305 family)